MVDNVHNRDFPRPDADKPRKLLQRTAPAGSTVPGFIAKRQTETAKEEEPAEPIKLKSGEGQGSTIHPILETTTDLTGGTVITKSPEEIEEAEIAAKEAEEEKEANGETKNKGGRPKKDKGNPLPAAGSIEGAE